LSHCSHSDYFKDVFTNFSGLANAITLQPMKECASSQIS